MVSANFTVPVWGGSFGNANFTIPVLTAPAPPSTLELAVPARIQTIQVIRVPIVKVAANPTVSVINIASTVNLTNNGTSTVNVANNGTFNGTVGNATTSYTYINVTTSKLCGLPAFCSDKAYGACANTSLRACAECSQVGMGFFAFFVVLLGLACVLGNVLVMAVLKKQRLQSSFNKLKFSLAVADFLTGIQLLVVSLYNFSWSINVTSVELDRRQLLLQGSAESTVGGIFLLLTFTSSLYHLVFMGVQRLYAIKWPLRFQMQTQTHVLVGLAVVWALAILSSTVAAWFPGTLAYTYQQTIFLFYITETNVGPHGGNYTALVVLMVLFIVLPYVAMTCITTATIFVVRANLAKAGKLKRDGPTNQKAKKSGDREVQIFVTVVLMQIGFTITMIPLVVINALFYGNFLTCATIPLPFLLCFYLSMLNSLVNVLVYSFRDKNFNKTARKLFAVSSCCETHEPTSRPTTSITM